MMLLIAMVDIVLGGVKDIAERDVVQIVIRFVKEKQKHDLVDVQVVHVTGPVLDAGTNVRALVKVIAIEVQCLIE